MKSYLYLVARVLASGFVACDSGARPPWYSGLPEGDIE